MGQMVVAFVFLAASSSAFVVPTSPRVAPPVLRHLNSVSVETLPSRRVLTAVDKLDGNKVTAGDVAAAGGISVDEAREGLLALSAALGSPLQVSKDGEIVYDLPRSASAELAKVSTAAKLSQTYEKAKPALVTAGRTAFGVALVSSLVIVVTALVALSASSSSDDRNDRREGGGGGSFYLMPRFGYSPFDVFLYRPYYYSSYDQYDEPPKEMNDLEAIFSFVFGDGDPNFDREQRVLTAVAAAARANGGVLIAEQLAPYLDPPEDAAAEGSTTVDESWVLPVLTKLNGRPEVVDGEIVYVFPEELMTTTSSRPKGLLGSLRGRNRDDDYEKILLERELEFSRAEDGQLVTAGLLGVANLVGVGVLGSQLAAFPPGTQFVGFIKAVQVAFPALSLYAATYFLAPIFRKLTIGRKNKEIRKRNTIRRRWLTRLENGASRAKMAIANRRKKQLTTVDNSPSNIVFDTSATAEDNARLKAADDFSDFDKRLEEQRRQER